jgi:hypothetical protein
MARRKTRVNALLAPPQDEDFSTVSERKSFSFPDVSGNFRRSALPSREGIAFTSREHARASDSGMRRVMQSAPRSSHAGLLGRFAFRTTLGRLEWLA